MGTLLHTILSYEPNTVMLAAILSLVLVIVFVILLHIYARTFLTPEPLTNDGVSASAPVVPLALGSRFYRLHSLLTARNIVNNHEPCPPAKGLDSSVIASIARFVYKPEDQGRHGLVCVICLSLFQGQEVGRKLQCCGHAFHVECIDMWLFSHTTCPICRAPAVKGMSGGDSVVLDSPSDHHEISIGEASVAGSDGSSVLDIVVEGANTGNELNGAIVRKTPPSSNVCT